MKNVIPTGIALGRSFEGGKFFDTYLFTGDEIGWIHVWNIRNYALTGPENSRPPSLSIQFVFIPNCSKRLRFEMRVASTDDISFAN